MNKTEQNKQDIENIKYHLSEITKLLYVELQKINHEMDV